MGAKFWRLFRGAKSAAAAAESATAPSEPPAGGFDPRNEYRIVADNYNGYEVQYREPIRTPTSVGFTEWQQCGKGPARGTNSHTTLEAAEAFARKHAKNGGVEKVLGRLP